MKFAIALIFSCFAASAFASDLSTTIKNIELENNAKCEKTAGPSLAVCSPGGMCLYHVKYLCVSNNGDFNLKVKMKSFYNVQTNKREETVRKVVRY
jgi:hypothetical protein